MKKILVCLSGMELEVFLQKVLSHLIPEQSQLYFLYIVDTRPAEELGYLRQPHLFKVGQNRGRNFRMEEADLNISGQVVETAVKFGREMGWKIEQLQSEIIKGRPEKEIVAFANRIQAGIIAIGTRYKGGPVVEPGPASIGPVARYVIDHSPCDLLVIKNGF